MRDAPARVEIQLGTRCNIRCAFCISADRRDRREPWPALRKVKAELRHFSKKGCRAVGFLGGEPTVYPHLVECVAFAKAIGYTRISLCTNGTRLADPDYCRRLVQAGVTRVAISVHSHRPEVEDGLITRVPGALARKITAIRNLMVLRGAGRLEENVSLNPVLCRKTYQDMEAYIRFFCGLGLRDIRFNFIWPQADVIADQEWIPQYSEVVPALVRVLARSEKSPALRLTFGGFPKCVLRLAGLSRGLADYFGQKYLEEETFDVPNAVAAPAASDRPPERFIWQDAKRGSHKRKPVTCQACRHCRSCEGVWRTYLDIYGEQEFQPVP